VRSAAFAALYAALDCGDGAAGYAADAASSVAYSVAYLSSSLGREKFLQLVNAADYADEAAYISQAHYADAKSARAKARADMADIVRSMLNIRAALTLPDTRGESRH
jgi:glutaredoxin-related protein